MRKSGGGRSASICFDDFAPFTSVEQCADGLAPATSSEVLGGKLVVVRRGAAGLTNRLADQPLDGRSRSHDGDSRNRSPNTKTFVKFLRRLLAWREWRDLADGRSRTRGAG